MEQQGVFSEFESKSAVTNMVDLAYHHSYNVALHLMNMAGHVT